MGSMVGGSHVDVNSYSFFVRIIYKKDSKGGGSLINDLYVLTSHYLIKVRNLYYFNCIRTR